MDGLRACVGTEVGLSRWHRIDQDMIDAYARLSGDDQYIHIDPARAATTAYGGTIAHGFLTVMLLSVMAREAQPQLAGARMSVNYGFDRLRFPAPVPSGARIRGRFVLATMDEPRQGEVALGWDVTVEVEGGDRPALVARWLNRRYLDAGVDDGTA